MALWLSTISPWAALVVILVMANGLAIALTVVARRWSRRVGVASGPPVVNSWATAAGALCGVLFGFSIVTLWNIDARAAANFDAEATAIRSVARDLDAAHVPLLRAYVSATLAEWPQLCGGAPQTSVDAMLRTLQQTSKSRRPSYADNLYTELAAMEDLRADRWQTAERSVPNEVWVGLMVASLALLVVLAMALPERADMHVALMLAIATSIGTLFWVTTVLEYPFCGSTAIVPTAILDIARNHLLQ
jgi:hypothetical protein